ncbi:hypothetical protein B9Z55_013236 [Caenorhabditis nigoni]|uniref:F-box domain-containing protein n=1 Tax=Caenorhabditis nigoni TaxID=1611254 RepID=A0A2G5U0Y3_9PELO|nr:hypothetical protein B9Z55_013236 [Caenorhabditis nigoni]
MSSDVKNITEKTENASIVKIYDTNWCDMPAEIKSVCIGKMKFKERLSLRCTAKAERSLVDSQKIEFDDGCFRGKDKELTFILYSHDGRNFWKCSKDMNDAFELLNYIKKVGVFQTLFFSFRDSFTDYERFNTDDGLFTAKKVEFEQCDFDIVVAVLRKMKIGVESIKIYHDDIISDRLAGILEISHVQNASYWHIHDYKKTDSLHMVAQMWIDKNAKVESTFQVSHYGDGSFEEFLEHFDDCILSKAEHRVRIRTNNPDCHILLERGFDEVVEIDDFPQFFRLKVISAEMLESEYDNDCREWICRMDPKIYYAEDSFDGVYEYEDYNAYDYDDAYHFYDDDDYDWEPYYDY